MHKQRTIDFMWEAIHYIPDAKWREAALQPDMSHPPMSMRGLVLADVGPIPESEVERLDPYVIDHTVLQQLEDQMQANQMQEQGAEMKREAAASGAVIDESGNEIAGVVEDKKKKKDAKGGEKKKEAPPPPAAEEKKEAAPAKDKGKKGKD